MTDRYNYHVVSRKTRDAHVYDGHDCPCEPRVHFADDAYRIIVHHDENTAETEIVKLRQVPGDEPRLLPGDTA